MRDLEINRDAAVAADRDFEIPGPEQLDPLIFQNWMFRLGHCQHSLVQS